ncbi:MAG: hypothetical protein P8163_18580 [Candidatus Thiodiazotropha sp.]
MPPRPPPLVPAQAAVLVVAVPREVAAAGAAAGAGNQNMPSYSTNTEWSSAAKSGMA